MREKLGSMSPEESVASSAVKTAQDVRASLVLLVSLISLCSLDHLSNANRQYCPFSGQISPRYSCAAFNCYGDRLPSMSR